MTKIDDPRLTLDLILCRSGSTMLFRKPDNRSLQSEDVDVIMEAPRRELYAKIVDGAWQWVNGCPECNGKVPEWAYVKCDKHDVCVTCGKSRKDLTEMPWGHEQGFRCRPCQSALDAANKQEALSRVAESEYDENDYFYTDEVICPHCASSYEPDDGQPDGEEICDVCGGKYKVEPEYTATYTTTVVGERLLPEQ